MLSCRSRAPVFKFYILLATNFFSHWLLCFSYDCQHSMSTFFSFFDPNFFFLLYYFPKKRWDNRHYVCCFFGKSKVYRILRFSGEWLEFIRSSFESMKKYIIDIVFFGNANSIWVAYWNVSSCWHIMKTFPFLVVAHIAIFLIRMSTRMSDH